MHKVVFDEPYEFIPPVRHGWWVKACTYLLDGHLQRVYGISNYKVVQIERLKKSLDAGHSVLLCPNHCRPSDPLSMGIISCEIGQPLYSMASWHIFKQSKFQGAMTRRLGGFSIYREGMDRAALNCAIDILTTGERPLVIFPEGVISRTNERLGALMDGTAFVARTAAKRRAALDPAKKVVVHPVGLNYSFHGDIEETAKPVLDDIEKRLAFTTGKDLSIRKRVARLGYALICLKEIEYLGKPQSGSIYDRLEGLIDHILHPLEHEWLNGIREGNVVTRVKSIRSAILPDMVGQDISEEERQRRWKQLADVYLAQQLWFYPREYLQKDARPERLLETIERIEEDLTDVSRLSRPWHLSMEFGEPIEVNPKRDRSGNGDHLMNQITDALKQLIGHRDDVPAVNRAAQSA
jgi:1-acyl-sn-glycerol-3-phosphate acyltransferase